MDDEVKNLETIDLSTFANPMIEGIRLDLASRGDARRLEAIKAELRREETRGWCHIHLMTDSLAVVEWVDQFALRLTDAALAAPIPEGS